MGLVVDDEGGTGTPVVCLPMLGMTRVATRAAIAPALSGASGLREIYLDLPGHGDSPGEGSADSQTILSTLCQWMETHLDRPALLAGLSYGGYLAAGIARQRPELVCGLLLVCPGVRIEPAQRDLPVDDERPPTEAGWLDAAPDELKGHLDRALGRRTARVVATVLEAFEAGGPGDEQYQDNLTDGHGYALADEKDEATRFLGPVSLLVGRNDRIVGYSDQFRALHHYPRATYSVLDQAGHYLAYEQPALFRELAQDWIRRWARQARGG